ncbi:MAG: J domain-containing protein [Sphingomonas sp.]|nr:J domain-containing protein [Sphingomonas sp.]
MGGDQSAYAVLGLEPGADADAVERSYKLLIKEHHPDRAGGNSQRAAEINRAYREVRAALRLKDDLSLHPLFPRRTVGWSRPIWAAVLLAVLGIVVLLLSLLSPGDVRSLTGIERQHRPTAAATTDVMDSTLNQSAIDAAVKEAVQLSRTSDEMALSSMSRQCHRDLRRRPNIARFDRCAAFDDAVTHLQDRDPLRDKGNFSQIAVTGRLWSAAAALSGDYMATDSRLQRIRVQVELLLVPTQSGLPG